MAELSKVDSFQYPAAHIGHLSPAQEKSLDAFKELCQKEGYFKPKGTDGSAEASHDDETLLRYLRARKFIPKDAFGQFKDTEDWRKENHLEELYEKINVNEYEETRRLYPQWTGRRDKRGIPVYLFEVAPLNSKALSAYEESTAKYPPPVMHNANKVPTKMLRLFALYENMMNFVFPLCTAVDPRPHPETPISQSNNIVDISKVGLKQFWYLKSHMQDASTLATAHYPETLDRIFIIGAPAFFPTVWGWIKRWFDPITVSKIFILGTNEVKPTLEKYIDIENIPKKYGGKLDYEFGMLPNLEPALDKSLIWQNPAVEAGGKSIPKGPIRWEKNTEGGFDAIAVGSENGSARRTVVAKLAPNRSLTVVQGGNIPDDVLSQRYDTETGTSTQPVDNGKSTDSEPPSSTPSGTVTPAPGLPVSALNTANPDVDEVASSLNNTRIGTSDTRYQQQEPTHASGQAAEGTPAVKHHGSGDKTVTMEPVTVGQAPKDVSEPLKDPSEDLDQPGYIDQAKEVANQVTEGATVLVEKAKTAVGLQTQEPPKEESAVKDDKRVDQTESQNVEEFLRAQVPSQTKDSSAS